MISEARLRIIVGELLAEAESPYSTFIRPDKDYIIDKDTLLQIVSELHLRRIGDWHSENS